MAARPIFLGTVNNIAAQILPADVSNKVTLYTPGAAGSRIYNIAVSSTDTVARDVAFYVTIAAVDYLLATVNIPINAGNANNIASVDVLSSTMFPWVRIDEAARKYIDLKVGMVLKAMSTTTVTAAKALQFFGHCGDL
jgi:hypothetical protein